MSERTVRASEISDYLFCRRAWWLQRVAGYARENMRELEEGTSYHSTHGHLVRRSLIARRLAYLFVFLAVATFVFLLVGGF